MTTPVQTSGLAGIGCFFCPSSVAVIGATDRPGSVGRTVINNLLAGSFTGRVYAVNPHRSELLGQRCYSSLGDVPEAVDLVVVVTPASTVPGIVAECVNAQAKAIVVISAGFKECGDPGLELEKQIKGELRRGTTRLIGPNCLGVMNPLFGLNATFAENLVQPGNVAFISQSGALLTAILDWSLEEQVGFSGIVSTGSMLDVGWGDLLSYFGEHKQTESILLYMESIGDARSFLSAAREVAFRKPIIVIKVGRSEEGSRAAASHTGVMTGNDEVYDTAFRRCGVLRVQNIADIFHMAHLLSKQPQPAGGRLTILTNAGGPGVLATDSLIAAGGELAVLSESSVQALSSFLPSHWSHGNPIDILGDADPERYARAMEIAIQDPNSDGLLAILAPQGMTNPAEVAVRLEPYAKSSGKPVLASWMGGKAVAHGVEILNAEGIPTFSYPDTAARAFETMWQHTKTLQGLYESTEIPGDRVGINDSREKSAALLKHVLAYGRTLLTEMESKEILSSYGIPVTPSLLAQTADDAVRKAEEIGYPVVLKLHSEMISHKTEVDGVKLNLATDSEVRGAYQAIERSVIAKAGSNAFLGVTVQPMIRLQGYELILGSIVDQQFGPVILFGSGGQMVEIYRDRALALPPLNAALARRLVEQTKVYKALKGIRGRAPIDLAALDSLLVHFSQLIVDHPRIREIDINPLLASPGKLMALDARIVLFDGKVEEDALPRPAASAHPLF